jgi:hypothetical protein
MDTNTLPAALSHPQLLHRFADLVRRDRRCTAEMLALIAEIDQRKLWAAQACPSMFAFCVERFHMSEAVAAKRIRAARSARRFPIIVEMVARGELHLSALHQLAKYLTDDNHRSLLQRATHKSSREIDLLIAEIAPRPDVPSRVRALPRAREAQVLKSTGTLPGQKPNADVRNSAVSAAGCVTVNTENEQSGDVAVPANAGAICSPVTSTTYAKRNSVVALSPRRYKIEITVDQDTHDKLRMLEDLLAHQVAGSDPAAIISRALDLLLIESLKKKAAITEHPVRAHSKGGSRTGVRTRTREIPAAIRREVWLRDGGRCAFVDEQGRRCQGRRAVEYHHIQSFGKGGQHRVGNLALRCQGHNQYQADLDFGAGFMNGRRQTEQAARPVDPSPAPGF